jgi:hypothetical protein
LVGDLRGRSDDRLEDLDPVSAVTILHLQVELFILVSVYGSLQRLNLAPQLTISAHQRFYHGDGLYHAVRQRLSVKSMENVRGNLSCWFLLLNFVFLWPLLLRNRSWFTTFGLQSWLVNDLFDNYLFDYLLGLCHNTLVIRITACNFTKHLNMLIGSFKLLLQTGALGLKLIDESNLRVYVLVGLILNETSFSCIIQGRNIFLSEFIGRR